MAFDNIKLEKGLYTTGKSFTSALEAIDPSENYRGTSLEGLDAYQRQLKRFDIKVSGTGSDTVEKFFLTTDSAALFPEYISRAVRQGMDESNMLSKIIATKTMINSLDYRAISCISETKDKELAFVAEGAAIPTTEIKTKDELVNLKKQGRMLVASYEAIKFQHLDLFTIALKQIGSFIARSQFDEAVKLVYQSLKDKDMVFSYNKTVNYEDLIDLWNLFDMYKMTTMFLDKKMLSQILRLNEFRDSAAGLNFHATGTMITPFGAEILTTKSVDEVAILAIDKNSTLEMVQVGEINTDFDKLIDRQLERAAITTITGFSLINEQARKGFSLVE